MEHGHDGLWNSMGYNTRKAVSIEGRPATQHPFIVGRSYTLFQVVRAPNPPHGMRRHQQALAFGHRDWLCPGPQLGVRGRHPLSYPGLVQRPLSGEGLGTHGALLFHGWDRPPYEPRGRRGYCLLWETDQGFLRTTIRAASSSRNSPRVARLTEKG